MRLYKYLLAILFSVVFMPANGCDVCGCGSGNVFLGMVPQFNKSFVGIRYHYRSFDSHLGQATDFFRTRETFQIVELYGGVSVSKKLQAMLFLPYQFHKQTDKRQEVTKNGLGDVTTVLNYQLWENPTLNKKGKPLLHRVSLGAGIKLPTGAWEYTDNGGLGDNANFQLGSGSLDFLGLVQYEFVNNNFGVNAVLSYKVNGVNNAEYHFGNRLSWSTQAYQQIMLSEIIQIRPMAGFTGEFMKEDMRMGKPIEETGGWLMNASVGSEISIKNTTTGMLWQQPVAQNLGSGAMESRPRWMAYIVFAF